MGTSYTIKYHGKDSSIEYLEATINDYLFEFNQIFSTYITNSEISLINSSTPQERSKGITVSSVFNSVLTNAIRIYNRSHGNFDPTIYPLVKLWKVSLRGYTNDAPLPSDDEIMAAKKLVGLDKVALRENKLFLPKNVSLDFSALAKGSGVDGVAKLLEENGFSNYMVEIGGEVKVRGLNPKGIPWQILVSPPYNEKLTEKQTSLIQNSESLILSITNVAVATSGDYLNYFIYQGTKYSHLFNPLTGRPIEHSITSVTVVLPDCESADAWATALIVMGETGIAYSEKEQIPAIFMKDGNNGQTQVIKNSLVDKYLK